MSNKVLSFGKKDANIDSPPLNNIIGLDTRRPETCEECLYYRRGECSLNGKCGRKR